MAQPTNTNLGRNFLIYVGDGQMPTEEFDEWSAVQSNGFSFSAEEINTTDKQSSGWSERREGGVKNMTLTASGVVRNEDVTNRVREAAMEGSFLNLQLKSEDGTEISGYFEIESFETTGEHNGAETFTASFRNAGPVDYLFPGMGS